MTQENSLSPKSPSSPNRFAEIVRSIAKPMIGRARRTASNFLERGNDYPKDEYFRITNRREARKMLTLNEANPTQNEAGPTLQGDGILLPSKEPKENEKDAWSGVIVLDGSHLNQYGGRKLINKYIEQEDISFSELEIEVDTSYLVTNLTSKRIGIQNYRYNELLIIPPFGVRTINSEVLKGYFFESWKNQNLISIEKEATETNQGALFTFGLLVILLGILVLIGLPTVWLLKSSAGLKNIGIASAVTLGLLFINFLIIGGGKGVGDVRQWSATLWDWLKLTPGVALVALTGFGLPLWIAFFWGGGESIVSAIQHNHYFSLLALGRLVQVGFICMASVLPALFYYLFGRQQVAKLREKFFRDVMILDPHLYTLSEAETKYDTLLKSAYGSSASNSPFAILLLVFSTALLVMGWVVAIAPYSPPPADSKSVVDFFNIDATPFSLGFLGAYFFSINMVFRRYLRADLTPKTYAYITVRLLTTLVLVWGISVLPQFPADSVAQTGILAVAFTVGIFPDTGLALIKEFVRKTTGARFLDDSLPLTDLEGMNLYDQARLLEEGIENIENLAHHNFVELLAFTRIPTPRLVDMFDQAILYLHVNDEIKTRQIEEQTGEQPAGGNPEKERNRFLNLLKAYGIRTATDLFETMEKFDDKRDAAKKMPDNMEIKRLRIIHETLKDDEWLSYIQTWKKETTNPSFADNPYTFYEGSAKRSNLKEDVIKHGKESETVVKPPETILALPALPTTEAPLVN